MMRHRPSTKRRRRCSRALPAVIACMLLVGCGVPGPQGPAGTYGLDFSLPDGSLTGGAIVFVVDGINAAIFEQMLDAGELPAIEKYFVARGLYAPRAVANTPSITLVNLTSIVTGRFSGHHGITANNSFDRSRLIYRDYETIAQKNKLDDDYIVANIYEHFPARTTFSVFLQAHRGATKFIENRMSAGPPFFFRWYEFVDRLTLSRFDIVADVARKRREFPAVTFAYLLAADFRGYETGVGSAEYRRAIRHTDFQIGRVLGDLERAGLLDKTVIALLSDHGLAPVDKHCPLDEALRKLGLKLPSRRLWEQTPFEKRLDYYRRFSAVLNGGGDRHFSIMLRKPGIGPDGELRFEPWCVRPSADDLTNYPAGAQRVNLLDALSGLEAVDAIAWRAGPGRVGVRTKAGEVEFRGDPAKGGRIRYRLIDGDDPLGWKSKVPPEALEGEAMTPGQWLEATVRSDYPDLPVQILAYFRARRAGDIAVFAAPGWDLRRSNNAGHGGLRPGDMHVPLLLAGPGVPRGRIDVARTVDLMPTLLTLLGKQPPEDLDGRSLVRQGVHELQSTNYTNYTNENDLCYSN